MKMRSFTAPNMNEAMALVRQNLGENAVIISSGPADDGKGVKVTAAADLEDFSPPPALSPLDAVGEALDKHGTPRKLCDKILTMVERLELDDPLMALAGTFDSYFKFSPLPESSPDKPILLVGCPGVGKTVTIAKLASRTTMAGESALCITADAERAGAVEQLEAFTKILKIELLRAKDPAQVKDAITACPPKTSIYIDTPGINVLKDADLDNLKEIVNISKADTVFVYAAGGDAQDAADMGRIFQQIGATRMLVTRLDMTRRYGSVLAAAEAGSFAFSNVSITPHIAKGLSPINPMSLARIFLPI